MPLLSFLAYRTVPLHLFDESKCRLYIFNVFNGDYATSFSFAHLALELACGYVTHYVAKEFACVVAFVSGVDKE